MKRLAGGTGRLSTALAAIPSQLQVLLGPPAAWDEAWAKGPVSEAGAHSLSLIPGPRRTAASSRFLALQTSFR